ncbi:uncharacterized protein PpBr36_06779 [Pyricularia pennisetigena]|uniref:uncharacterized protein n=1 Tax=Pyricularia pennisetigena TaxID=1578925 RepID=UPI00114EC163|nr:uncharacterized protein PpBr36_06780 [Pyricularia pennisetigena]XP_029746092.1 uncharacterized protein PpBr36_06779 [Pyricularia pennisetigena]TLS22580.1 hypothetical protein PpBr36_06780 [Pyricularia pennisetigena]TLS23242.1 hypothetical protein PpBr36_06779 [Pyricularia pennisetigena]
MNFKSFITLFFVGAAMGAATPSDESAAPKLERRDCYQNCLATFSGRYSPEGLPEYCRRFCAAKARYT